MNLSDKKIRDFFVKVTNQGLGFGTYGSGFMRLNFAVSTEKMEVVVKRLDEALSRF